MAKKCRNGTKAELERLTAALVLNGKAMEEGPKLKNWNMHDLKIIQPLTSAQDQVFHSWYQGFNLCAYGSAGTGKSYLAIYLALEEILKNYYNQLIIIRSAVPTRDIGFLPGTEDEKLQQYELPYHDIFWELLGRTTSYQNMKDTGIVRFISTSFIRGLTWTNSIVVVDECQNLTFHEINSVMTRLTDSTRIILTGDLKQTDLNTTRKTDKEGLSLALQVFQKMNNFDCIHFTPHDIVKGNIVKSWIEACESIAA